MRQQYLASDPVPQFSTAWNYIALKVYAYSKNVVTFGRDGGPDKPGRGNGVRSPAFPVIVKAARTRLGTPFAVYRRTSPNPKTCPIPGQAHRGGDRRAGGKASAKQTRVKLPSNSSYSAEEPNHSRPTATYWVPATAGQKLNIKPVRTGRRMLKLYTPSHQSHLHGLSRFSLKIPYIYLINPP